MQIVYFPFLTMGDLEEINLGEAKIWNFDKTAEKYIPDVNLRDQVKKLLETNVFRGKPIRNIGVLSIGSTDFREFTYEEIQLAQEMRLILFLASLSKMNATLQGPNAGHFMTTSENFIFTTQNFQLGGDDISEQTGYIVRKLDGGYKVGEKQFHAPSHLLTPMRLLMDGRLIVGLDKLKKRHKKVFRKILQATDLLFESYFNDPHLSRNARILLQVGSLEVLLDLPESGQRKELKDKIERYTVLPGEKSRKYYSERGSSKAQETRPLKVIWADKFYTLRNHIIHGNVVSPREFNFYYQRHIDIAVMFFVLLVKQILNEIHKKQIFFDCIKIGKFTYDTVEKLGFVYEDNSIMLRLKKLKI